MTETTETLAREKIGRLLERVLGEGRSWVREDEAYEVLRLAGIDTPATVFFEDRPSIDGFDPSSLPGGTVICKLVSPDIPHRSEHGGVRKVECSAAALRAAWDDFAGICSNLGGRMAGMLLAELLDIDEAVPMQLLATIKHDPSFGPVVIAGIGGTGTEVWESAIAGDKGLFIASARDLVDGDAALKGLERTLFYPVLTGGTRVSQEVRVSGGEIRRALGGLARLAASFPVLSSGGGCAIEELEINPLQVTGDGRLVALDALMKVSRASEARRPAPQAGIEAMLRPSSVLVIGASARRRNMGRIILGNLTAPGRLGRGQVYVLHPEAKDMDGCRAVASPKEVPGGADMTVFTIPASEDSVSLLEELISGRHTKSIILISGGFGETAGGKHLSGRLRKALDASDDEVGARTVVNGPNCMGIVSGPGRYNTFFLPEYKLSFDGRFGRRTAVISQSGAWLVTLLSSLGPTHTPEYLVTVGNQIDLTVTDYLEYLGGDPGLDLFVLYLEGFVEGDGERFLETARRMTSAGKKIIVYKTGRTEAGAAAAASHTAAMATDHDLFSRLVRDAGIYEASTLEDMEDAVRILTLLSGREARGRRVAVCSDAGFECSVAGDRLYSLELADFSPATVEALSRHLPDGIVDVHNPVDTTPAISTAEYGRCIEAILADPGTDVAVVSNVAATATQENLPAGPGHDEDITREGSHPNTLIRLFRATDKPMVVCMNEGSIYDPAVAMMKAEGIPVFRKIDRAMKAMDLFVRFSLGR